MVAGSAPAVYQAQSCLAGTRLDIGVTPARIAELVSNAGLVGVKVKVLTGSQSRQAFAVLDTSTLYFAPAALTMPIALHEIAHLLAGPEHGPAFVVAFCSLVAMYGSDALAERLANDINASSSDLKAQSG